MPYKPRDQFPGFHHVVCRGNNKRITFQSDEDRDEFLGLLEKVSVRHSWTVYAYALMRNHYHLVLLIGDRGLAAGMCELNTAYATRFNQRNNRINHLFGKRYWSERLGDDRRLMAAIRYVVQNPRRAGEQGTLESHTWTSYAATIGLALSRVRLAKDDLLLMLAPSVDHAIERFRELCETPVPTGHPRWQPP